MKMRFLILFLLISLPAHSTGTWCAHPKKTSDGFVSLRTGPSTKHSVMSSVTPSDTLFIDTGQCREAFGRRQCDDSGKWVFVEAVFDANNSDKHEEGWVNSNYIAQAVCSDSH